MAPLTRGFELLGWAISYALASTRLATPQRLPGPTPCAGWDLGWLLHHVSDSVDVVHQAITTGCIDSGPAAADDGPDPDVVSGLQRRAGRLLASCALTAPAAPAGRLVTIGDLELPAKLAVAAGAIEITVHGWDISVACGSRQAGPAGPGGSPAADRPAVHHPRHPGGIVRRPGPGACAGLPGRPAGRLPRPSAARTGGARTGGARPAAPSPAAPSHL